jgi:asparagine synthase (glutamine-hydrolysing)
MCGIAGLFRQANGHKEWQDVLRAMTDAVAHRGPDCDGQWLDLGAGVALGFRRLAIIDLSALGDQPMLSASGRYVAVFNGEVYNFRELRQELETATSTPAFRGHSDTEVMLAAIESWGLLPALRRLVGMYAMAIWDRSERCLYLARDRMGEKPLYYGWLGDTFAFASELKALRVHPQWHGNIDRQALALYLRYGYIPAPYCIYEGIYKQLPATLLRIDSGSAGEAPQCTEYWSLREAVAAGSRQPFAGNEIEAVDELERLLLQSVRGQMIADVPLGAFLSGGIDSSAIVAMMQAQSMRPVKTFSIGFEEQDYNEAQHAEAVANCLRTDHTELYVTAREAQAVIPKLPTIWDEPFADSSQIPTYLVAELARRHVTVSLSGDAGDELFAGYPRYQDALRRHELLGDMPGWVQNTMRRIPRRGYGAVARTLGFIGAEQGYRRMRELQSAAHRLPYQPVEAYRQYSMSHWLAPDQVVVGGTEPQVILTEPGSWPRTNDLVGLLCYLDLSFYLPNDILVKVDRAAMAVSLETRVPFLDHRVVEFAQRLPVSIKLRQNTSKWVLKQILYRYVPPALVDRPKMGFGVPIDSWLRHELRDWAETLLERGRLDREGLFNVEPVRKAWQQHIEGKVANHYLLWDVLVFQQWYECVDRELAH